MPKKSKELSALSVSKIKKTGRHSVGGVDGLCLNIEGNSRVWILRAVVGNRLDSHGNLKPHRRDIGLGPYPEVSLAEARAKATELRLQIRNGIDPIRHKQEQRETSLLQQQRQKTFRECAKIVIEKKTLELKNEKHIAQWTSTLETYIYPVIGDRMIGAITKADIVTALEPIWIERHETAKRVRGRIETIFDYAKAMEYFIGDNPAAWKGNLEPILGNLKKESRPHPSLPYMQISGFIHDLRQKTGISPQALEFAILTACRSGEVFGAIWKEIDFKNKIWIIPKERMKADKEHRVPLTEATIRLLEQLYQETHPQPDDFIFPAPRGGMLSDMSLTMLIKRMHDKKLKKDGDRYNKYIFHIGLTF